MRRTLKQEVRTAEDWRAQQREMDRFRRDYNEVRPHEALEMQTPASVYEPLSRPYPARTPEAEYPDSMQVVTVQSHDWFSWKKPSILLSQVLWGDRVGLEPVGDALFTVYFARHPLIGFDARRDKLVPLSNPGWIKHPFWGRR